jgi:mRNA-degrading endonuclease RelE of RelBE toxin-antitoxin system
MNNGNGEITKEMKEKSEIRERAYKELDALKKAIEKLKKEIMQETGKNPLPSPQKLPAEDID